MWVLGQKDENTGKNSSCVPLWINYPQHKTSLFLPASHNLKIDFKFILWCHFSGPNTNSLMDLSCMTVSVKYTLFNTFA